MSDSEPDYPTECTRMMRGHEGVVLKVVWNADGNYCLSAGGDMTVRLWNPHRGLLVKTYRAHGRDVYDVAVEQDNSRFVSCGGDRLVFQWDVGTGRVIRRFRGHTHRVNSCALTPDGSLLVTGSYDATVKIWDLKQRGFEPIDVLKESKDSISTVLLDGQEIVAGSVDGCVRVYDVRKGEVRSDHFASPVSCVSISNDSKCMLVSTMDEKIRLMDRNSGECLATYTGHVNKQYRLDTCLSNTDAHVLSASEDGAVYIWDLVECEVVKKLREREKVPHEEKRVNAAAAAAGAEAEAEAEAVTTVAYHKDEVCCLSAGFDGIVRLWT